jgi:hypothetical protein
LNGHTEKSDAFRDMLGQAVPYSAWQGQLEKSSDKDRGTLGQEGHIMTAQGQAEKSRHRQEYA